MADKAVPQLYFEYVEQDAELLVKAKKGTVLFLFQDNSELVTLLAQVIAQAMNTPDARKQMNRLISRVMRGDNILE